MTDKSTAALLQVTSADSESRQQMIVLPNSVVFRRSITPTGRTQWRYGTVGDLPQWVQSYVTMAEASTPTPMTLSHGLVLMEVTGEEIDEAATRTFPRNVGLRFQRVLDELVASPGDFLPTPSNEVAAYIQDWIDAVRSDNETWLAPRTHPKGSAVVKPAPAPVTVPEPEPDEAVTNPHGWVYPPMVGGFVTRPNGERYRVRKIEGEQDVDLLRKARLHRDHAFLWGEPGTGKTALVEAAFGDNLVTMLGTEDTEPSDFIGSYTPIGKGKYVWTDGAMVTAMENGWPLFIDECGVIAPKTMTTCYSVMDGRDRIRITANPARGEVVAAPGFFVILATNPHAPGVRISEALTSRCALSVQVGTDFGMMRTLGVPDELVTMAENLQTRYDADEPVWVPQARELLRAARQIETYGSEIALRNLVAAAPEDDREVLIEVMHRVLGGSKRKWLKL